MADTRLGKIGITVKEPWAADISYEALDVTLFAVEDGGDGCSYTALRDNIGVTPGTDPNTWVKSTQAGQSIYDLAVKYHHFVGTEEEFEAEYQAALQAARDAAAGASAVEAQVEAAEALRVAAEASRADAESARQSAEASRASAESARGTAEAARQSAESGRASAETARASAEAGRVSAESERASAEAARAAAETDRVSDFSALKTDMKTAIGQADAATAAAVATNNQIQTAETGRVSAEQGRVSAETARASAESARATAESGRATAETARVTAEGQRATAEGQRVTAENARVSAEGGRASAESGRVSAEEGRVSAETARESQASSDHTRAESDHAIVQGYDTRLTTVEGEVSQLGQELYINEYINVELTPINGEYYNTSNILTTETGRRHTQLISCVAGEKYRVKSVLGLYELPLISEFDENEDCISNAGGHGTGVPTETTFEYTVPSGVSYFCVNCNNTSGQLSVEKIIQVEKYCTEEEVAEIAETKAIAAASVPDEKVDGVIDDVYTEGEVVVALTMTTGEYYNTSLTKTTQSGRQHTQFISVREGDKFRVTSVLGLYELPLISEFDVNGNYISYKGGHGTGVPTETTFEYTVPSGVSSFVVNCNNTSFTPTVIKENATVLNVYKKSDVYSKEQADSKFVSKSDIDVHKYGIRWPINDYTNLGERIFDAIGLNATIGVGSTNGSSDFDNIYPWSEMKRCNIKDNANGARIVTFEGETGFSLDGSNGDVFVRIPKFYIEKYVKDGYEHRVVSSVGTTPHPAFVENGKELDEIFIAAFEGHTVTNNGITKLHSYGGVLPTSNLIPSDFLAAAKANGDCYSLYDMRSVDAIFTLMSIEFGCRNSTVVFGNGISQYSQPNQYIAYKNCILAATNTNTIRTGYWSSAAKEKMPVGSNMLIFKGQQTNIIKWGKVVSFTDGPNNEYTEITFSGEPIDVDTTCTIGSSAQDTNWCETCGGPLSWHTGRAAIPGALPATMRNPMRYRWIENIVGNLWHYLPDITFNNLQMYVCNNMASYEFFKVTGDYKPIGALLPEQNQLGDFVDADNYNYWITTLQDNIFAKGVTFGNAFTQTGVTSQTGFGGFYYLDTGLRIIANGGGFDHEYRCNILTHRAWINPTTQWYLYGARLLFKNIQ